MNATPPRPDDQPPIAPPVTPQEQSAAAVMDKKLTPWWAIHRRMYDWVLGFAHHRYATGVLAGISFAESSFFPIPPDVLLAPMCLGNRAKAWWFATVCTISSTLGGLFGYLIGFFVWLAVDDFFYSYVKGFSPESFAYVQGLYNEWGFWVVFLAAFTPIPYKVATIAGGVMQQSIPGFIIASTIGRGMRFFAVAIVFKLLGERATFFIDKYFNALCLIFGVLLIGGFVVIGMLGGDAATTTQPATQPG